MTEYVILLAIALVLSAFSGNSFLSGLVVAMNFIANETFVRLTGSPDPWWFFGLTDLGCATILILMDFGRTGAGVAGIFATQVLMHAAFYISGERDHIAYLDALYQLALIQLLILAIGGVFGGGRFYRIVRRLRGVDRMGIATDRGLAKSRGEGE